MDQPEKVKFNFNPKGLKKTNNSFINSVLKTTPLSSQTPQNPTPQNNNSLPIPVNIPTAPNVTNVTNVTTPQNVTTANIPMQNLYPSGGYQMAGNQFMSQYGNSQFLPQGNINPFLYNQYAQYYYAAANNYQMQQNSMFKMQNSAFKVQNNVSIGNFPVQKENNNKKFKTINKFEKPLKNDKDQKKVWPPSLVDYVGRCFKAAKNKRDKNRIQQKLKKCITEIVNNQKNTKNVLTKINWNKQQIMTIKNIHSFKIDLGYKRENIRNRKIEILTANVPKNAPKNIPKKKFKKANNSKKPIILKTIVLPETSTQTEINSRKMRFKSRDELRITRQTRNFQTFNGQDSINNSINEKFIGTNKALEKPYLRLTSKPESSQIRPLAVLKRAFNLVKKKLKNENNYRKFLEQMKSIRQDLSVQHIKNGFAVDVYETNARICIKMKDLSEFNQCQTVLAELYSRKPNLCRNEGEFLSYRLVFYLITRDTLNTLLFLRDFHDGLFKDSFWHSDNKQTNLLKECIELQKALQSHNYSEFFKIYSEITCQTAILLLDQFLEKIRYDCLSRILKAFLSYPLKSLCSLIGIEEIENCRKYLEKSGIKMKENVGKCLLIDCKRSKLVPVSNFKDENESHGVTHGSFD